MSTYTPIASITAVANTTTLIFDNIPQTYNDLILTTSGISQAAGGGSIALRFNNDTLSSNTNYSYTYMFNSATGTTAALTNQNSILVNRHSTTTGMGVCHINDYSSSTKRKTAVSNGGGNNIAIAVGGTWRNTEPITRITMTFESGPGFAAGFTANLYGVGTNVIANAKATGGDIITTDNTYWYHIFKTSGTFIPKQSLTCDYLVIAGGGGGGGNYTPAGGVGGGGGGAGGLRSTVGATGGGGALESALSLSSNVSYTVTIGAGGVGGLTNGATGLKGANGSNSVFSTITATGGGYGGAQDASTPNQIGGTGGSGGGSYYGQSGGTGTANQGYNGGAGATGTTFNAGGGGGAGAVGVNANNATPSGGAGVSISALAAPTQTGINNFYAGGGGGGAYIGNAGAGGSGGGGAGSANNGGQPTSAYPNTGGGGGGAGYTQLAVNGANGGSGLVIVRYAV